MSWSITLIGTAEKLSTALAAFSEKLTDKSKEEFDAALPHLQGLVNQNFGSNFPQILRVTAAGHGFTNDGKEFRQLSAQVEPIYGELVV